MNTIMMPMCFHKVVKFKSIGWDFTVWLLFLQANSRINMVLHWRLLGSCFHVSDLMKLLALLLFWQAHLILQMSKLYHGDKYWYRSQGHSYVIVHQAKVMAFGLILIYIDEGVYLESSTYIYVLERWVREGAFGNQRWVLKIEEYWCFFFLFFVIYLMQTSTLPFVSLCSFCLCLDKNVQTLFL